jgi:hypothetical protein
LYVYWISRDSILYLVCFKIFPRQRLSADVSLPGHDFGSKFRNPPAAKVGKSARWIVVQRWDSAALWLDRTYRFCRGLTDGKMSYDQ